MPAIPNTAIVIPVYRSHPLWYEEIAIKQAIGVLMRYDHFLVVPAGLDVAVTKLWYASAGKSVTIIEFEGTYFQDTQSYNKLLLEVRFYGKFHGYEYLLIHQTDAFVFREELSYWTNLGYDYVGAPWIDWIHASCHQKNKSLWGRIQWRLGKRRFDAVGNGGLSLRKVKAMIDILEKYRDQAAGFTSNEDFFFAFGVEKLGGAIRIPSVKQALGFAFDEYPEKAFAMSGERLPMGCHAWPRYQEFWSTFIDGAFNSGQESKIN